MVRGYVHPIKRVVRRGVRASAKPTEMKYTKLGNTGLDVSRICLGCMSYGSPNQGTHDWALDEAASRPFIQQALDAGINFFDTANVYSLGASEEVLGRAIKDMADRDEVVIATKVAGKMRDTRNGGGLSRKAIMSEIDHSLRRLDMDYVDLYQIHRWDPTTPIEETLEALHDVVRSGKARYIGASSMWAWQFTKALMLADQNGWTRFTTMQNHYNLVQREEEREMMPLCQDQNIGVIPWSPMARGLLTRPWGQSTYRTETDAFGSVLYDTSASDKVIVDAVGSVAEGQGIERAQVALAWMLQKDFVDSPIIGATKAKHLDDAVAALDVSLSDEEIDMLEAPYVPHPVVGFR